MIASPQPQHQMKKWQQELFGVDTSFLQLNSIYIAGATTDGRQHVANIMAASNQHTGC